jgi:hypothetical protein
VPMQSTTAARWSGEGLSVVINAVRFSREDWVEVGDDPPVLCRSDCRSRLTQPKLHQRLLGIRATDRVDVAQASVPPGPAPGAVPGASLAVSSRRS